MTCPKPFGKAGPCYSIRCSCLNCRNKAVWRDYSRLLRSCIRRPPQYFLSLVCPWRWYGENSTQVINRFRKLLLKLLPQGTKLLLQWRYDGSVLGRYPHLHVLVWCSAALTTEMVDGVWKSLWPDDTRADGHCEVVHDVEGIVKYFTKHGQATKQVKHSEWRGRLSGGDAAALVASKKMLWEEDHYRCACDTAELVAIESRCRAAYPGLYVGVGPAVADTSYLTKSRLDCGSLFYFSPLFRIRLIHRASEPWSRDGSSTIIERERTFNGTGDRNRIRNSGSNHVLTLLRFTLWPNAPTPQVNSTQHECE